MGHMNYYILGDQNTDIFYQSILKHSFRTAAFIYKHNVNRKPINGKLPTFRCISTTQVITNSALQQMLVLKAAEEAATP